MNGSPPRFALALVVALVSPACSSERDQGCVDVAGVWNVNGVTHDGMGITCDRAGLVWTLSQTGCNFTIAAPPGDSANGASGGVTGNHLYVEWLSSWDCYRVGEFIDATVAGGTMSGVYGVMRWQVVYPGNCPGTGSCRAVLSGVRQTP